jgi:3-oxoacyl-[acyl-carrier-protein] synthase-1
MTQKLAVTGMGMISAVGHNAQQTCASLRAGITRLTELEGIVDRYSEPVIISQIQSLGSIDQPAERTKQVTIRTFTEVLSSISTQDINRRRTTLSVLLKEEERPGNLFQMDGLLESIVSDTGLPPSTSVTLYPHGNAAGMKALADAQRRIKHDPQAIEFIWGIDSLLAIQTLAYLERSERLKAPSCPRGVIPGEASVCLVLQGEETAISRGLKTYCRIEGIGTAVESAPVGSESPCLGEGLTNAIYAALEAARWQKDDVERVYCDLNGEVYRAHEWMLALCRTLSDQEVTHPAECIGDVGAAFSPLLIGMAAIALDRGYTKRDKILVFCSSDFGNRGSACVAGIQK